MKPFVAAIQVAFVLMLSVRKARVDASKGQNKRILGWGSSSSGSSSSWGSSWGNWGSSSSSWESSASLTTNSNLDESTSSWTTSSWESETSDEEGCYADRCYAYRSGPLAYAAASAACAAAGGVLAALDSAELNAWAHGVLMDGVDEHPGAFLGATDAAEEGAWAWEDGRPWGYTNWYQIEPNNAGDGEDCLKVHAGGTWNDDACDRAADHVCQRPVAEDGTCAEPYLLYDGACYSYQQEGEGLSWAAARANCHADGGDLAVIRSAGASAFVWETLMEGDPERRAWLGATDAAEEGVWVWVTGDALPATNPADRATADEGDYANWYAEPNNGGYYNSGDGGEDCLELRGGGTWNDISCEAERAYICEVEGGGGGGGGGDGGGGTSPPAAADATEAGGSAVLETTAGPAATEVPTTAKPTTSLLTTLLPTNLPMTTAPATSSNPNLTNIPTTFYPTNSTAAQTTMYPSSLQPTIADSTTLQTTLQSTLQPTTVNPTTLQPTLPSTIQPTTLNLTTLQPTSLQFTTLAPTTLATVAPTALQTVAATSADATGGGAAVSSPPPASTPGPPAAAGPASEAATAAAAADHNPIIDGEEAVHTKKPGGVFSTILDNRKLLFAVVLGTFCAVISIMLLVRRAVLARRARARVRGADMLRGPQEGYAELDTNDWV